LKDETCLTGYKFERGHPVVYYQICIICYAPSIHNIHQDKMQSLQLGYIW